MHSHAPLEDTHAPKMQVQLSTHRNTDLHIQMNKGSISTTKKTNFLSQRSLALQLEEFGKNPKWTSDKEAYLYHLHI